MCGTPILIPGKVSCALRDNRSSFVAQPGNVVDALVQAVAFDVPPRFFVVIIEWFVNNGDSPVTLDQLKIEKSFQEIGFPFHELDVVPRVEVGR